MLSTYRKELEDFSVDSDPRSHRFELGEFANEDEAMAACAEIDRLRSAVKHFETGDRPETGDAYAETYPNSKQPGRFGTADGLGVATDHPVSLVDRPSEVWNLCKILRNDGQGELVSSWIAVAKQALGEGDPWPALVVGRDLFHFEDERALPLLTKAYRMLGRDALAEIAEVHHRHRGLQKVDVYERNL